MNLMRNREFGLNKENTETVNVPLFGLLSYIFMYQDDGQAEFPSIGDHMGILGLRAVGVKGSEGVGVGSLCRPSLFLRFNITGTAERSKNVFPQMNRNSL